MSTFWVTFYSYKGGVGRSLALANLAALLAKRGRRVLMVDFDLEAPGLDNFDELAVAPNHPGVVEYFYEYFHNQRVPDLREYIQACAPKIPLPGKLWLMSSGSRDINYNAKRLALDWDDFYENRNGALFVENWKAAISQQYKPDYVFVDSRTGLTDVGGVCTLHLPDLIVLMFSLNQQNIRGTSAIVQLLKEAKTFRPPQILPVATPVPNLPLDPESPLQKRLQKAKEQLGLQIANTIGYNPEAALLEKLYTIEEHSLQSKPVFDYSQLLLAVQGFDKSGLDSLLTRAKEACKTQDLGLAAALRSALLHDYPDRADAYVHIGLLSSNFRKLGNPIESWQKALQIDPENQDAYELLRQNYERRGNHNELVSLVTFVSSHAQNLNSIRRRGLYATLGQVWMARGEYKKASAVYSTVQTLTAAAQSAPTLQHAFNWAEAKRRSEGAVDSEILTRIISLFEAQTANLATQSWDTQANFFQAMHIPYAIIGRPQDALELLKKAKGCADRVGETQSIFCVKSFRYDSPLQFLADNAEMLAALYKATLWDGYKIPKPAARTEN